MRSIDIVPNCKRSADDARLDAAAEAESVDKALNRGVQARLAAADSVGSAKGLTPLQAISKLRAEITSPDAGAAWLHTASACALAGSCPHSHSSVRSGFNSYLRFARTVLGPHVDPLPPSVKMLLAWSTQFRCKGTFENYLGYVRLSCELLKLDTAAFDSPLLSRAKRAVEKKLAYKPREKMFIRLNVISDMLAMMIPQPELSAFVMLYHLSYAFHLRLPSEALPLVVLNGATRGQLHSTLEVQEHHLVLRLSRRKNKPWGSVLKRGCWCAQCPVTCPLHVIGAWALAQPSGTSPSDGISSSQALRMLRSILGCLKYLSRATLVMMSDGQLHLRSKNDPLHARLEHQYPAALFVGISLVPWLPLV